MDHLGAAYAELERWEEAIEAYQQAMPALRAHPIGQALGRTQARLGFVLWRAGRVEEAREAYAEALREFERSGDAERAAEVRAEFEKLVSTVSDLLGG
ncbi:tetratricopeptide repeat protein [Nonomuraea angiospora]|uniref:tetratricopeptide repeat protein n=1 Tax=Nonomuraea angiospora TaxID=46172 RepID=UPI0029A9158C|nr:tetratricopeptide repeat protein [Nonomuraea angiospora]MDX3103517.1 tetratricopeptide repeat protein [Nonomuraea angiospora]